MKKTCTVDEPCEKDRCQSCCPHPERDHEVCVECGHAEWAVSVGNKKEGRKPR